MKAFPYFLLIPLAGSLAAQNWSPILVNQKMNYQHSDSSYISHTIWVDSAETVGSDIIYHLNRIVKDVQDNPEIVLRNQPQFLLKRMKAMDNGIYVFNNPGEFTIKTLASIGEIWMFDSENNITAEFTSAYLEDIFGTQDSIKVINLSNANEILLSKSFGIFKFPDFENGGYYELVGIQKTDYGESVPDFWDIFDFEVGDVFQYSIFNANLSGYGDMENNTKKYAILSKNIQPSSVSYEIEGIMRISGYTWGGGMFWLYSYPFTENLEFTDSSNHFSNLYSRSLMQLWECESFSGFNNVAYSRVILEKDANNRYFKKYGILSYTMGIDSDLYYLQNDYSDTLHKYSMPVMDPEGLLGMKFTEGLGAVQSFWAYWEGEQRITLEGYVKNGDTVGIITPDSLLLVNINSNKAIKEEVNVFPNPADKTVNFKFPANEVYANCTIEIRNLMGEITITMELISEELITLDIGNLKQGIYFYSIKSKGLIIKQGKLVIR